MPTYTYRCDKCDITFEEFHSMNETVDYCKYCNPPSPVKKVLSKNFNIKRDKRSENKKPGKIVNKYIQEAQEELKQEKERLSKEEYT